MDSITRQIRRNQWLQIIEACQNRSTESTVTEWCEEHDINRRQFYYWLRKFRLESAMPHPCLPSDKKSDPPSLSFIDITDMVNGFQPSSPEPFRSETLVPELMLQVEDTKIYVSSNVQLKTLETVMKVLRA